MVVCVSVLCIWVSCANIDEPFEMQFGGWANKYDIAVQIPPKEGALCKDMCHPVVDTMQV